MFGLLVLSDLLLVVGFVLVPNFGDGPGWLTIAALLGGGTSRTSGQAIPRWWPNPLLMNLVVFVPNLVCLWRIVQLARASRG